MASADGGSNSSSICACSRRSDNHSPVLRARRNRGRVGFRTPLPLPNGTGVERVEAPWCRCRIPETHSTIGSPRCSPSQHPNLLCFPDGKRTLVRCDVVETIDKALEACDALCPRQMKSAIVVSEVESLEWSLPAVECLSARQCCACQKGAIW